MSTMDRAIADETGLWPTGWSRRALQAVGLFDGVVEGAVCGGKCRVEEDVVRVVRHCVREVGPRSFTVGAVWDRPGLSGQAQASDAPTIFVIRYWCAGAND